MCNNQLIQDNATTKKFVKMNNEMNNLKGKYEVDGKTINIRDAEIHVLSFIAGFERFTASRAYICSQLNMKLSTVSNYLSKLEKIRFITTVRIGNNGFTETTQRIVNWDRINEILLSQKPLQPTNVNPNVDSIYLINNKEKNRDMQFIKVHNNVFFDILKNVGKSEALIYITLLSHKNSKNINGCYPSVKTMQQETGISDKTINKAIKNLSDKGYITIRSGTKGTANRYYFPHEKEMYSEDVLEEVSQYKRGIENINYNNNLRKNTKPNNTITEAQNDTSEADIEQTNESTSNNIPFKNNFSTSNNYINTNISIQQKIEELSYFFDIECNAICYNLYTYFNNTFNVNIAEEKKNFIKENDLPWMTTLSFILQSKFKNDFIKMIDDLLIKYNIQINNNKKETIFD